MARGDDDREGAARTRAAREELEVDGVSIRLGDRQVLDDVSFRVPAGRVVGLLGPNGAGKTTAMRVVFGVMRPDAGRVLWSGRPVGRADRDRWGYMPQERGLYPKMGVRAHLVYLARLRGMDRAAARRAADRLLEALGLGDRARDRIERLSGGMQQRAQLAAALVHGPELVVLDEPFAGLDPVAVEHLSQVIVSQAAEGRAVVFSSHQLDLVEELCESIVLIDHGRVVLAGDLHELRAASGRRTLRVGIEGADPGWARGLEGASLVRADAGEAVLQLDPGAEPLAVLDRARAAGRVHDVCMESPRLSQLFLEAVRR